MCFGGPQPQAPTIEYQGPSEGAIQAQREALSAYQTQMANQQKQFEASLQQQIDLANSDFGDLKAELDALEAAAAKSGQAAASDAAAAGASQAAAAGAAGAAQQVGAYTVTAQKSEPVSAQTTTAVKKKEKPRGSLKFASSNAKSAPGAGLNIGA